MDAVTGRSLEHYVRAVVMAGAAAALAMWMFGPGGQVRYVSAGLLTMAAVVSIWTPLRIQHRGEAAGFTLEEAIFVGFLFTVPGMYVPLLMAATAAVGHLVLGKPRMKVAFNVGQVSVWASAATAVFHVIGPGDAVLSPRSIGAVVGATLVHNIVNSALMGGLFSRLGQTYGKVLLERWHLHVVMWIGNSSLGLLLAFVTLQSAWATVLVAPLMVGLYLGYQGYAGVLEERERNERLHDVTQTLASATGSPDALGRFLRQLGRLFGGERVELVVIMRDTARYLASDEAGGVQDRSGDDLPRILDEALHGGRAVLHSEVDAQANHRDALAAPLIFEHKTIGAMAVYDRHGLEPWDANDVKLLSSLAHEAAVAVKNVELVADLSEETRKLGNIVTAASDGIALIDEHGRIVTWNPALERMTGLRSRDVIGQPWTGTFRVDDDRSRDQLFRVMETVLTGRSVGLPVDIPVARVVGDHRWLRCTVAPVDAEDHGHGESGAVLIARDVTREREAEELKTDFIATVSHELRTPLTPLKGFLATAERHWDELDREQLREMVTAMRRQVDRLEDLIADLLTVSEFDRGAAPVTGSEIDLTGSVEDAIEMLPVAAAARVEVEGDPSVRAVGDARAVQRVIRALTDNALKHTTGMVTVSVSHRGGEAAVAVSDHGPGIGEWDRDRIFERFGRLGDHLTRNQGSGLGLAIARSIAEQLGGRLELESEVGSGSTFVLVLPRATTVEVPAG